MASMVLYGSYGSSTHVVAPFDKINGCDCVVAPFDKIDRCDGVVAPFNKIDRCDGVVAPFDKIDRCDRMVLWSAQFNSTKGSIRQEGL